MLSEAVAVPVTALRLWQRRGLLRPSRMVGRLAYFDDVQFQNAKVFARLYNAGLRAGKIADKIESLDVLLGDFGKTLHELPIEVVGREIYLRKEGRLLDPNGQRLFDFNLETVDPENRFVETVRFEATERLDCLDEAFQPIHPDVESLCDAAWELEEEEQYDAALELYRAALLISGPEATIHFQIAELLYRRGELTAARERYYTAIELDENYVEARANLGCVLAELGELDLAVKAFEGALRFHPDYADVHFHLAKTYETLGNPGEAAYHRRLFETLSPESPWSRESR